MSKTKKDLLLTHLSCIGYVSISIGLLVQKCLTNDPHNNCNNFVNERTPFFEAEKY